MALDHVRAVYKMRPETVSSTQRAILQCIAWHVRIDGTPAYPSVETVCFETSFSERAVQKALRDLCAAGFLKANEQFRRATSYGLQMDAVNEAAIESKKDSARGADSETVVTPDSARGADSETVVTPDSARGALDSARGAPTPHVVRSTPHVVHPEMDLNRFRTGSERTSSVATRQQRSAERYTDRPSWPLLMKLAHEVKAQHKSLADQADALKQSLANHRLVEPDHQRVASAIAAASRSVGVA